MQWYKDGQEVARFADFSQFVQGESTMQCGPAAVAMCKSAGSPNVPGIQKKNVTSKLASQALMKTLYERYNGPDVVSNEDGTTVPELYAMLHDCELHYQALDPANHDTVRAFVRAGYPVIVAFAEKQVVDMTAEHMNPYPWVRDGSLTELSHIITITGMSTDKVDWLVRDTANSLTGPRTYAATGLDFLSATAVVLPWLQRPVSADPSDLGDMLIMTSDTTVKMSAILPYWTYNLMRHFDSSGQETLPSNGIMNSWQRALAAGHYFGPPISSEMPHLIFDGKGGVTLRYFTGALAVYSPEDGKTYWYDGRGLIGTF